MPFSGGDEDEDGDGDREEEEEEEVDGADLRALSSPSCGVGALLLVVAADDASRFSSSGLE